MELSIQSRTIFGKKVKTLRRQGLIPAEIFGRNFPNEHIAVAEKDFNKIYKTSGENTIIELVPEKTKKKISVLISDVVYHPMTGRALAVDFRHVAMDEKIQTKVPIELAGNAPATKNGLMIIHVLKEIEIEALPSHIPHHFAADVSPLAEEGQSIHVSDLTIPKEVKIFVSPETVIAIVGKKAQEEVVPQTTVPVATTETTETTTKTEEAETNPKS